MGKCTQRWWDPEADAINDSGGKFVILGPVESDDAQTMRGLPHMGSKKAVSEHVLWERSPLFGFPTRVMNVPSPAFGGFVEKEVK